MKLSKEKFAVLFLSTIFLISFAAAEWEIELVEEYPSFGAETDVIHIVELTKNDDPMPPGNLGENESFWYRYNLTEEEGHEGRLGLEMTPYNFHELGSEGYYYAEFETEPEEDEIDYKVVDEGGDTTNLEYGESKDVDINERFTFEVESDFSDEVRAGSTQEVEIDLWDNEEDREINRDDVDEIELEFTNITETDNIGTFAFDGDGNVETRDFEVPHQTDTRYVGEVKLHDLEYDDGEETVTDNFSFHFLLDTKPPLEGEISEFGTAGDKCDTSNFLDEDSGNGYFASSCEGNATIDLTYEVLESQAEEANLTIQAYNDTENENNWQEIEKHEMENTEGNEWEATFDYPYINSSEYETSEGLRVLVEAASDTRSDVVEERLAYSSFETSEVIDLSPPGGEVVQGQTLTTQFDIRTPYSNEHIPREMLQTVDVVLENETGGEYTNMTLDDLSDDDNVYEGEIETSGETIPGTYELSLETTDIYGATMNSERTITVRDIEQTFEAQDMEFDIDKKGVHEEIVNITNVAEDDDLVVEAEIPDSLNETLFIENQTEIELSETYTEHPIQVNMTEMEDIDDEVIFHDNSSEFNHTASFEVQTPECNFQDNDLCSQTGHTLVEEHDELESVTNEFDILYLGESENTTLDISTSGNITDYLSYDSQWDGYELNHTNDNATIPVDMSFEQPGYFEGNLTVQDDNNSELNYQLEMNSTVPPQDLEFELDPSNYQSDEEIVEGDEHEIEFVIDNTGDLAIEEITASSDQFTASLDEEEIGLQPGEDTTQTLTLEEINEETGDIEIEATSEDDQGSQTISVNFEEIIENYEERITELAEDLETLEGTDEDNVAAPEISDGKTDLDEAKIMWDSGEYDEAISYYETASQFYDDAQQTISDAESDPNGNGDTGNGDTGTDEPEEGGIPFIPIVAGLFMVIIVGFVAYSSIIPEEGDPLYDVLGQ